VVAASADVYIVIRTQVPNLTKGHVLKLALFIERPYHKHLLYPFLTQSHTDSVREAGIDHREDDSVPLERSDPVILDLNLARSNFNACARVEVIPARPHGPGPA